MTVAIQKQLDESLRDALLALYLNKVVPDQAAPKNLALKTARDLYEYWLLDVLVSQDVPTTPVACAIASLQQYINRILMNLEPGYDLANIPAEYLQTWRNEMHRYPSWAAHQKLLYFPATYLDPTLRADKSDNFRQLESALSQNQIQTDAVQSAVMAYLTRFEEIANLNVLNGYIDGEDFANSTWYFIAKSRSANTYFWRSLNMAQRPLDGPPLRPSATTPKLDQPDPQAWSDWEKAEVPIPDSAAEQTIRPVWFNNRLFVIWAECIHQDPSAVSGNTSNTSAALPGPSHPLLRLNYCFKRHDGSWSAPQVGLQGFCEDQALGSKNADAINASLGTVAVQHSKGPRNSLYLALCASQPKTESKSTVTSTFSFIKTISIGKNLAKETDSIGNAEEQNPRRDEKNSADYSLIDTNDQRIQSKLRFSHLSSSSTPLPAKIVNTLSNFDKHLNGALFKPVDSMYRLTLGVQNANFPHTPGSISFSFSDHLQLNLAHPDENLPSTAYIRLGDHSYLTEFYVSDVADSEYRLSINHMSDVIRDDASSPGFMLSQHNSLSGKFISVEAARYLIAKKDQQSTDASRGERLLLKTSEQDFTFWSEFTYTEEAAYRKYVVFRQPKALNFDSLTYEDLRPVAASPLVKQLPAVYEYPLRIEDLGEEGDTLFYGVALAHPVEPDKTIAFALKATRLTLAPTFRQSPCITSAVTPDLGTIQYIDFANSAIKHSDGKSQLRQPIRLNTVFAAELIRRTENSLDELFDWTTQHLPEPAVPGDLTQQMDFHGPYGRYFTELFLYVPWLVAHRLNTEHRYEEAEHWLRYVFDPSRRGDERWRSVPLLDSSTPAYANHAPHDPHQIALSHPVHFCKALYFLYIETLINRGDAAYRQLTPDSLSEAKLWYVRVLDLLGPRPVVRPVARWTPVSLQTLSETPSAELRTFEQSVTRLTRHQMPLRKDSSRSSLPAIDSPYLHLPFNPQLLSCWDTAESRLYNLRHNLDIAGKPLHLPAFASPLDPRALPGASALNITDKATPDLPIVQMPHYRFTTLYSQAQGAVESLSQFGALLLSLTERKEQAQLQELQQQQAWDLAKICVDLQRQAMNTDRQGRQALLAGKAIIEGRVSHYKKLLEDNLSDPEKNAGDLYLSTGTAELVALSYQIAAGGAMVAPSIFGLANGGSRWEGPMLAASAGAHSAAVISRTAADQYDRLASFNRRWDEWYQAFEQSQLELAQIDAQLAQFAEQETATRLQLRLAESTLSQARANYEFLSKRFSKTQLYQWLNSQFAALYRQAYDATLGLCLAAEASWQYETADFNTRFVQPGGWNATYRGLGAGEQLKLSLLKMQDEYLRRHERELEIRKTVSLRLLKDKTTAGSINKQWPEIKADLKNGSYQFELTHELFENDYKDQQHYLRRIKTISVSLPAVVGPYEDIRATLTQTASKVFMSPGDKGKSMESRRANQQIALSTGVDDNGLFTLNFNDERYLPFEYTGAISKWQLTFPNPEGQKELLESLTDIIVHVNYTARVGGGSQ
ncbi:MULTISPECIES: neuraminidase-like domain-containing protein [unclassified Pseudomonas]|uniref:Tc toxin subunit A-related protein n=1 Tax=unclassified Pseudomonas TaxID=196821 RepID=UPI0011A9F1F9|nr:MULTISPECIES: neuraminidase-like domain-containing protein [unclassified Pseudomonas]TWC11386.1 hypothetical protein FBY00_13229 [Pseudomonas sp. SJZ075]TWC28058.1 hypothetical protein FBY02_13416 [Pseudomonas sp. SJZ078]TWC47729.1 hypothetical protein FBY11_13216 [Pseudomonas sp. SJZ124]TWC83181.1 hypothetical protein FBY09_13116 [Pseudomonas sp. SJZ101]